MKKAIFSTVALFALMLVSFAASAQGNGHVEAVAKLAAIDAGCTGDYHGPLETTTNQIGTCDCGDQICIFSEVYVAPKVNPTVAPFVRVAPFARVTMCGTEVLSVECIVTP